MPASTKAGGRPGGVPTVRAATNRGKGRTATIKAQKARARCVELRELGLGYREIAAACQAEGMDVSRSLAHRYVQEAVRDLVPIDEAETVRRFTLQQIDRLIERWWKVAMGDTKVPFITKDGGVYELPPELADQLRASAHIADLLQRRWVYSGLDKLMVERVDANALANDEIDAELQKMIAEARRLRTVERLEGMEGDD